MPTDPFFDPDSLRNRSDNSAGNCLSPIWIASAMMLIQSPEVVVVVPQTYRRLDMQLHGAIESFVIMFQPDRLHRLFSIPMHELTDRD